MEFIVDAASVYTQVAILEHAGGSEPGELDLGSQHPSFMTDHTVQQVGILQYCSILPSDLNLIHSDQRQLLTQIIIMYCGHVAERCDRFRPAVFGWCWCALGRDPVDAWNNRRRGQRRREREC